MERIVRSRVGVGLGMRMGVRVVEVVVALAAADGCLRFIEWWHRGVAMP
jgi:hypothetical protein